MDIKIDKYFEIIIILLTASLIIINEFIKGKNLTVKGLILISLILISIAYLVTPSNDNSLIYKNSLLSLNLILMTSYTIFQWNRESQNEKENWNCAIKLKLYLVFI